VIRATLLRNGKVNERAFDDVATLAAFLDQEAPGGGEVLVRVPDDASLYELESHCAKGQVDAARRAKLVGGTAHFWGGRDPAMMNPRMGIAGPMLLYPDADGGWRLRLVGMQTTSRAVQPVGGLNGKSIG
jgi:hypothetical protein